MGKKHNKFKKHGGVKHHPAQHQAAPSARPESEIRSSEPEIQESNPKIQTPKSEIPTDEIALLNEKYAFVRHDVRKLMIVLTTLAIIFVATYFLNTKTTVLANLGNWVYRVTHISI